MFEVVGARGEPTPTPSPTRFGESWATPSTWTRRTAGNNSLNEISGDIPLLSPLVDATPILWSSGTGSAWLTGSNWTGGSVPTASQMAQFGVNPTSSVTGVGINFNNPTNGGPGIQEVGAIEVTAARTANLVIGNSSSTSGATGTLRLKGVTVNGLNNVILRNNSAVALIIQNIQGSGNQTMAVELGNPADNLINIDGSGPIVISSVIKDGAGSKLTLGGAGSGSLTLSGANTFTGGVTVGTGILQLGSNGVVSAGGAITSGPVGTGTLTLSGGTTLRSERVFDRTIQNNLSLSGNITLGATSGQTGALTFNSTDGTNTLSTPATVMLTGNTTLTTNVAVTIADVISGAFSLTKSGSSTLTLSGANTYSGGTTLNAGTLEFGTSSTGSVTNGPVGTGTLTLNGGTLSSDVGSFVITRSIANAVVFGGDVTFGTATNFGALAFSGAGTLTGNRTLTFVADVTYSGNIGESGGSFGITKNGSGTLKLSGFNTYSGGTTVNAGLLWLNSSGALGSSSGALTVNGGIVDLGGNSVSVGNLTGSGSTIWNNLNAQNTTATLTIGTGNASGGNYSGVIANNNGASNGILALTKTGTGTITLSGANTYSGATTINGGTLLINNTSGSGTGTSAVTVNNGGTLGGTGTITGGGTVTINSGGTIRGGSGAVASGSLTVNNTLTLNSNSVIQLALGAAGAHSTLALGGSVSFQPTQQFNFINLGAQTTTYSDIITGVTTPVATAGWTITNPGWSGVFTYDSLNQSIDFTLTAIPEPDTWFGGALALSILLYTQRRKFVRLCRRDH